jgi:hypothetical protein
MEKILNFANNGIISLLDLTTMGDSSKRTDSSKIGQFDSGLKYAISILVRNNVDFEILTGDFKYTFSEYLKSEEGKSKNLIQIKQHNWMTGEDKFFTSAFAVNLGFDWEFWMAVRELFSNCIDENGGVLNYLSDDSNLDTQIIIDASHDKISNILDNWDSYFINDHFYFYKYKNVKIYHNTLADKSYRIYKNGVLVYHDPEKQSMYLYEISNGQLDERRQLLNINSVEMDISYAIRSFDMLDYVLDFTANYNEDFVESRIVDYGTYSDQWVQVINELHTLKELPALSSRILGDMYTDRRFELGKRKLSSSNDWYAENVMVEEPVEIQLSFSEAILKMCNSHNIELKYPVKESIISNSYKVLADTRESCLYVSNDFSEADLWEIVKEQYRLDSSDKNLIYKDYVTLLSNQIKQVI